MFFRVRIVLFLNNSLNQSNKNIFQNIFYTNNPNSIGIYLTTLATQFQVNLQSQNLLNVPHFGERLTFKNHCLQCFLTSLISRPVSKKVANLQSSTLASGTLVPAQDNAAHTTVGGDNGICTSVLESARLGKGAIPLCAFLFILPSAFSNQASADSHILLTSQLAILCPGRQRITEKRPQR